MAIGKSGYLDVTCMPQSVGCVRVYWQEDYYNDYNYSTITITDIQGYLWHRADWAYIAVKVTAGDVTVMDSNEWMISCQADTSFRSAVPRTQWDGTFTPVTSSAIYHDSDGAKTISLTFTLVDITCSDYNGTDNQSASATVSLTNTHTHSYSSSITKEATCATTGVRTYTCSSCGDSYTEAIPATGNHTYSDGICTVCGITQNIQRRYKCYIDNGSSFVKYNAYIDNGSSCNKKFITIEIPRS